jgi:NADH:ubiquinone oxidoreductase subunit B-like Fe-S oxidoreductase
MIITVGQEACSCKFTRANANTHVGMYVYTIHTIPRFRNAVPINTHIPGEPCSSDVKCADKASRQLHHKVVNLARTVTN